MFLAGLVGATIFGGLATLFGGTAATIITASIVGGVLCAVVSGILTKDDIKGIAESNNIKGELKIRANRSTNVVRLENLDAETELEIKAPDGIADDVRTGDSIYV